MVKTASNLACATLLSTMAAGWAAADGVVIASTSAAYPEGAIIGKGQTLVLTSGETVSILDRSGELLSMNQSGAYLGATDTEKAPAQARPTAMEAALWTGQRADIGGTRTEDLETCLADAETRPDLSVEDCQRAFPDTPRPPALEVGLAMRSGHLRPNDLMIFKVEASFDAKVSCTAAADLNDAPRYALSLGVQERALLRLSQNVTAMAPQRGSPIITAPEEPGTYRVDCIAVDVATVDRLTAALDENIEPTAAMMRSYARVNEAVMAETTLKVVVRN